MKGLVTMVIVICSLFLATGYMNDNHKQINNFSKKQEEKLKENARSVSEQEWQNDEVPLREMVSLEGTIIKSDRKSGKVENGDRFLLQTQGNVFMIFNDQNQCFRVGEQIKVYGEYYGFIKELLIERRNESE
ncbi:hypothetical protein SP294_000009 [Enterococcus faecium]|uniref:Uncharacterized protein n=1 Tax=Enterococcus faecium TaxID=1352 RepID=A0A3F3NRU2_ENTFC|nr:hypothetical protein [Enterococcus faecium]ELZ1274148.1 hypothetical protein [Enterococcus faecium]EME8099174.1 hypothetical protein [Enterococcus faecium]NTK77131.1 hypothetical protein [Enterococcus faecium]RBS35144.1 hypothetical protein EB12_00572 [Enterococcus faecium]RBS71719.1 hypothetical protein EB44_00564 [Enterococcus faecium]